LRKAEPGGKEAVDAGYLNGEVREYRHWGAVGREFQVWARLLWGKEWCCW